MEKFIKAIEDLENSNKVDLETLSLMSDGIKNSDIAKKIRRNRKSREIAIQCIRNEMDRAKNMEWLPVHYEGGILDGDNFDKCSNCGYERLIKDIGFKTEYRYCPECGKKAKGAK